MTTKKTKKWNVLSRLLTGLLLVAAVSCSDHFDSLNKPSNRLTADQLDASTAGRAFAQTQYRGMWGSTGGPFQLGHSLFPDIYAQYFQTTHESFDSDRFVEVGRWINGAYVDLYANSAPQLFFLESFTAESDEAIPNAMVKVWKVQYYHRITDYFGPIIYSQFGNGQTSVPFDKQEDVYMDFFKLLDEADAVFAANAGVTQNMFTGHDLIYNGNVDLWRKFANSLRLRLAMRISYANPGKAEEEAKKAVANGVIETIDESAYIATNENSYNPYRIITQWGEFRMSATMESVMQGYNDPRAPEYFTPAEATGEFHGMRNGVPTALKSRSGNNPKGSDMGIRWLPVASGGLNHPIVVLRSPEVWFLRAEAALRGWIEGDPEEFYNEGIRESLREYTGLSETEINAYVNSGATPAPFTSKIMPGDPNWDRPPMSDIPVQWDAGGDFERNQEQIITQKWIALYPDSPEAWAERRRTGYPRGYAIMESANQDVNRFQLMRRLTFVDDEYNNNKAATEEAVSLLGGPDNNATRLWWDKKPLNLYPNLE